MKNAIGALLALNVSLLASGLVAKAADQNLFAPGNPEITIVAPEHLEPLESFALSELARHIELVSGKAPKRGAAGLLPDGNVIVIGQLKNNEALKRLADEGWLQVNRQEQGSSIRIDRKPGDTTDGGWLAVLCGADPLGALYAVRDFAHYYCYREGDRAVLHPVDIAFAPTIKVRQLSESGCNLFSAENPHSGFMFTAHFNRDTRSAIFDKHHYIDWLSEWKINSIALLWCNYPAYDKAYADCVRYAHSRGIRVAAFFCPFRPGHEKPPGDWLEPAREGGADCPRDPRNREWYFRRVVELVTREPRVDSIVLETPEHDGIHCDCPECTKQPYPGIQMLHELVGEIRKHRPDLPISLSLKEPTPSPQAAKEIADRLIALPGPKDWYSNSYPSRADRVHWHDLGPKYGTYLRPFRSRLQSKAAAGEEIDGVFSDFRMAAERDVLGYGFCYRFYGGKFGGHSVHEDAALRRQYPDRKGAFSLALLGEAAFDPFVSGEDRAEKIRRIYALTIPDYPRGRLLSDAELAGIGRRGNASAPASKTAPQPKPAAKPAGAPTQEIAPNGFFRRQYQIPDLSFCNSSVCADFDGDGRRELLFASRNTKCLQMLNAADGAVVWSKAFAGDQQSLSAYDLDHDGTFEILYSVSSPGRLYVLNHAGEVLRQWDSGDGKLGNSPVLLDADGDGKLEGHFGSRSKYLVRLNMDDLSLLERRSEWVQCGCHTSAMDVDCDGRWDLFAGSGDDSKAKGVLHRYDPVTLKTIWSYRTDDNASSADAVLADIDGDGQVEVIKSVDNYAGDDAHDAIYAFKANGTLLWKLDGLSGEDSPNVADLDGDGEMEIVGMTFGGEVYCLDASGRIRWRKDLRPELGDAAAHAYLTPILCDLDGDRELEILALTNGGYFDAGGKPTPDHTAAPGVVFALSASGEILDRFQVDGARYWGDAFVCNLDGDPFLELVVSGSGGLDVIETNGRGPNTEHFQRRRTYQRLNVLPWAYEDSYFIYRGAKDGVVNLTDNLVLAKQDDAYRELGSFTTELLHLPPGTLFDRIDYEARTPPGTQLTVDILDGSGQRIGVDVATGSKLSLDKPIRLKFVFSTTDRSVTPLLDSYSISFRPE